jgi:hypothetical protein
MNSGEQNPSSAKDWIIIPVGILVGLTITVASLASSPATTSKVLAGADPGALVSVQMTSQVGVLLDEIPEGAERDRTASILMDKPDSFWTERAKDQINLMSYRLVFREAFYDESEGKGALPLPSEEVWKIEFKDKPFRATIEGHDLVLREFTFASTLLTDERSPGASEPNLGTIGGIWEEPLVLPLDPQLLFQRTAFACMDEDQFPPNSVDSEEVATFYDQEMEIDSEGHYSEKPSMSCVEALEAKVGKIEVNLVFERLEWNPDLADQVRVGQITNPNGADLMIEESVFKTNRLVYRYITLDSCSYEEGSVQGTGWRKLLQFGAADRNYGAKALEIGDIDYFIEGDGTELSNRGIYEYSDCHQHYHFKHYGSFTFGDIVTNQKMGFCLQSTNRLSNNELSPLTNIYAGCSFQGIEAGWVDEYRIGLDNQWVDVTEVDTSESPVTATLSFHSNPDSFLCEGEPVLDSEGNQVYEETQFKTDDGLTVYRAKCHFGEDALENNIHSYEVTLPLDGNGYITEECKKGEIGPLRNCGFEKVDRVVAYNCTPEESVRLALSIPEGADSQIVRVCEYSNVLATSIACTYNGPYNARSLANAVVVSGGTSEISFVCPGPLDGNEPGGKFSVYFAPLLPDYALVPVNVKIS